MIVEVEPVKLDGQHWVSVTIGGSEMERRGPFADADEAESVAGRLSRVAHALTSSSGGKHG
jgi:hypothetical protein